MLFNLDEAQGDWFQFFSSSINPDTGEIIYDDPVKDARVQIRSVAPFFEERIANRKKAVEHVYNPKTRQMERISYIPELPYEEAKKERDDTWDYVITGIEGFKDAKTGTVLKCDRETKLKLMKNPVFDRFVAKCLQTLASYGVKEKEEQEKNS